jgi:hypothetical protein
LAFILAINSAFITFRLVSFLAWLILILVFISASSYAIICSIFLLWWCKYPL